MQRFNKKRVFIKNISNKKKFKMKKTQLTTAFILIFLLFSAITVAQSTETRNLSGFTKVDFGAPGKVNIRIGSEFNVAFEGEQVFLDQVEAKISNGTLIIRRIKQTIRWWQKINYKSDDFRVTVNITMPAISGISVSSLGNVEVFDSIKTGSLSLKASDLGGIILNNVSGEYLNCEIEDLGRILVQGNGSFDKADIRIKDLGRFNGEYLKLETSNVKTTDLGGIKYSESSKN